MRPPMPFTGYTHQVVGASALPLTTALLAPDRWRPLEDLRPGDVLLDGAGAHRRVLDVVPAGLAPVLQVKLADGSTMRSTPDQLWDV